MQDELLNSEGAPTDARSLALMVDIEDKRAKINDVLHNLETNKKDNEKNFLSGDAKR